MSDTYTQLGDLSDIQFEKIWNNPGTIFMWKSSVEKRGKSGVRQSMYKLCKSPKEMRKLYQEQVMNKSDAFKSVNAKEEFKWDFKRGNVSVIVPKTSQSPFFKTLQVAATDDVHTDNSSSTITKESLTDLLAEEDDDIKSQTQASPMKTNQSQTPFETFPKTPIQRSQVNTSNSQKLKKRSKTSQSSQSWNEIFSQPKSQVEETIAPLSSAEEEEEEEVLTQPRTPIPFHIRQKLETQERDQPVIKSVPLSYDSSWLKRSSKNSSSFSQSSPNKRPWYSAFQN